MKEDLDQTTVSAILAMTDRLIESKATQNLCIYMMLDHAEYGPARGLIRFTPDQSEFEILICGETHQGYHDQQDAAEFLRIPATHESLQGWLEQNQLNPEDEWTVRDYEFLESWTEFYLMRDAQNLRQVMGTLDTGSATVEIPIPAQDLTVRYDWEAQALSVFKMQQPEQPLLTITVDGVKLSQHHSDDRDAFQFTMTELSTSTYLEHAHCYEPEVQSQLCQKIGQVVSPDAPMLHTPLQNVYQQFQDNVQAFWQSGHCFAQHFRDHGSQELQFENESYKLKFSLQGGDLGRMEIHRVFHTPTFSDTRAGGEQLAFALDLDTGETHMGLHYNELPSLSERLGKVATGLTAMTPVPAIESEKSKTIWAKIEEKIDGAFKQFVKNSVAVMAKIQTHHAPIFDKVAKFAHLDGVLLGQEKLANDLLPAAEKFWDALINTGENRIELKGRDYDILFCTPEMDEWDQASSLAIYRSGEKTSIFCYSPDEGGIAHKLNISDVLVLREKFDKATEQLQQRQSLAQVGPTKESQR